MHRNILFALVVLCSGSAGPLLAGSWTDKMFAETRYDFGRVARAAQVEHEFVITNPLKEELHIAGVRSSCGCTNPRVTCDTLQPGEQGAIVAAFNTTTFIGQHGATLTVTIDRPHYAEIQLRVDGYIRTDVVVSPGEVAFGSVDRGATAEKKVIIDYAGRGDWRILGVTPNLPYLAASVRELSRAAGRVSYELTVQLGDDAPAGYLHDQLTIETNDQRSKQFPVKVEGLIVSELMLSPSTLMLGTLNPGQKTVKQIIIRAKKPFRVTNVVCDSEAFTFGMSDVAKLLHVIPVTFVAGDKLGKISQKIRVETDLSGEGSAELSAFGQVVSPLAGK